MFIDKIMRFFGFYGFFDEMIYKEGNGFVLVRRKIGFIKVFYNE